MNKQEQLDRHAHWKVLIDAQEKSGLSQAAFCKQNDIDPPKFYYYRSLLKEKTDSSENTRVALFSPVKVKKQESNIPGEIRIVLPNGFQCHVPRDIDLMQIKRLLEVMLSC